MSEPLISVVIPIYNTEKYLKKCLDSIISQTYKNLEIICINDGSTDASLDIITKYAKTDNRIKIINQKNSGVSHSRNVGIEQSSGDWISFIDSDDYVYENLYENFVSKLNNSAPFDMYIFNGEIIPAGIKTHEPSKKFFYDSNWELKKDNLYTFIDCKNPFYGNLSVWNKIFSKDFLNANNIRFKENIIFEDQLFSVETMIKSKKFYLDNVIMYQYIQHSQSTMHSLKENGFDIFEIMNDVKQLLIEYDLYEHEKYCFLQHKFNVYTYLLFKVAPEFQEKFYNIAKRNLHNEALARFSIEKIKQINKSFLFFDFVSLSYADFVKKHR